MRKILIASALIMLGSPVYAWPQVNNGGAGGTATGGIATGGSITGGPGGIGGRGGQGGTGGRGGSVGNAGNGNGNLNVAPSIGVPSGYGNAPCGGGVSLGGVGMGGGGSGGGSLWEFGDCKRLRESAALRELGYPDAALAELCQIDRVRDAFGGTCPSGGTSIQKTSSVYPYDYCATRNAGDKNQHLECDKSEKVHH
jgi:hypothetical protein